MLHKVCILLSKPMISIYIVYLQQYHSKAYLQRNYSDSNVSAMFQIQYVLVKTILILLIYSVYLIFEFVFCCGFVKEVVLKKQKTTNTVKNVGCNGQSENLFKNLFSWAIKYDWSVEDKQTIFFFFGLTYIQSTVFKQVHRVV